VNGDILSGLHTYNFSDISDDESTEPKSVDVLVGATLFQTNGYDLSLFS
jgi:hypothetical protein